MLSVLFCQNSTSVLSWPLDDSSRDSEEYWWYWQVGGCYLVMKGLMEGGHRVKRDKTQNLTERGIFTLLLLLLLFGEGRWLSPPWDPDHSRWPINTRYKCRSASPPNWRTTYRREHLRLLNLTHAPHQPTNTLPTLSDLPERKAWIT